LKIGPRARCADSVRARAAVSLGCMAAVAGFALGVEVAHASGPSPHADPNQLFGVHPLEQGRTTLPGGHFNYALVPGQSIADGIVVENFTDRALNFHVYGADLLTAAGGGLAPAQPTAPMREVGAWITVSVALVTIPAHSQFTDAFTLALPGSVFPGEHLGAVVAAADVGVTPQGSPIEARTALIAVVTVPGTVRSSASLTALRGSTAISGQIGFGVTLSNTGNVLLTYSGSIKIVAGDGARVAVLPLTPTDAYVVPQGRVPLAAIWKKRAPLSGTFRAQATVTILADGSPVGTLTSQSVVFTFAPAFPLSIIGVCALALLLVLAPTTWLLRRRRRSLRTRGRMPTTISAARLDSLR
jgi:hypothetical protein